MSSKKVIQKLSFGEKFSYGLGDCGANVIVAMCSTFLTAYYTDTVGIAAAAVGTMMLLTRIFDGITDGLSILRDMGVRQAVVTSKRREPALFTMRQFALDPYFELLIAREDTDSHKPNPEPIFAAAERLGQKDLSRVLYVGDSVHDLRCANNAGVDAAAVEWTYMPREELIAEKPKYWLSRLSDLSCILSDAEL